MTSPTRKRHAIPIARWIAVGGLATGGAALAALVVGPALAVGSGAPAEPPGPASDSDVALLVLYVLLALIFSFLCSVAEAVLLSITPSYIAGLRERRPRRADLLQRLKQDDVDRSLAAILTLNTIAHTVGAIGSGSKAAAVFGSAWFGLFSAIMTLMILFLSEIIPKTLGAVHWRRLAWPTALFVRGLIVTLVPLIWVSEKLTRLFARGKSRHGFNREEFVAMAGIGESSGHLEAQESRILRNLFRLRSLGAADVMTPRTVLVAVPETTSIGDALDETAATPFSRLPAYRADLDDMVGFVLRDDLLLARAEGRAAERVDSLKRELATVAADMPLSELLERLLDHRRQIVLVVDEYGGTKGLVTLEDVVETLLGAEIVDETDSVADMQALARRQWAARAKKLGLDAEGADGTTVSS